MIYCVEDDASIRELIVYTLQSTGFEARGFSSGEAFFEAVCDSRPELVLLDVMLPGEDGITILRKLRTMFTMKQIPVIMVTAKGTEYDKVLGLDSGADDYIAKPFGMMEMVSRVKAVLRRSGSARFPGDLEIGPLKLSAAKHILSVDGDEITLTRKEFELLRILMEHQGIVLNRDQLLELVWGFDFDGETRTVDVHIGTLRQKLGDRGSMIETIRGVGYRIGGSR